MSDFIANRTEKGDMLARTVETQIILQGYLQSERVKRAAKRHRLPRYRNCIMPGPNAEGI